MEKLFVSRCLFHMISPRCHLLITTSKLLTNKRETDNQNVSLGCSATLSGFTINGLKVSSLLSSTL